MNSAVAMKVFAKAILISMNGCRLAFCIAFCFHICGSTKPILQMTSPESG